MKNERNVTISFYVKGMSVNDIDVHVKSMYDLEMSTSIIAWITNALASELVACQNMPFDDLYLIGWMGGIVSNERESSKVINKMIYLAVGLNREGRKEGLGMWLGKN